MKTLTAKDYCPNLRADWSVQNEIIKRVNREAECSVVIPTPELPKYEYKKEKWSKTAKKALAYQIRSLLV